METVCLGDPDIFPDDPLIAHHLGKGMDFWTAFMNALETDHPALTVGWQYYRDGGSWLCRVLRRKKVVCWVSVRPSLFRVTFYFGSKNDAEVAAAKISAALKSRFLRSAGESRFRPLTIDVRSRTAVKDALELVALKERLS